ncbi:MAG: hypothetical protein U1E14_10625 [Geminicoccaceae bacterium]
MLPVSRKRARSCSPMAATGSALPLNRAAEVGATTAIDPKRARASAMSSVSPSAK